jgi:RNA polymerase sigma factor (sigma-70 family)
MTFFRLPLVFRDPCAQYPDPASLMRGLHAEEPEAIRCLSDKIASAVHSIGRKYSLSAEDIKELHIDAIVVMIQKIREGAYRFMGFAPSTYAIKVAGMLARNYQRASRNRYTLPLESAVHLQDGEEALAALLQVDLLERLLSKLDERCRTLITLKFLKGLKDQEVLDQHLTAYTTLDSLKNNRARCMKKLSQMATEALQKGED